jgi:hypothetical protein
VGRRPRQPRRHQLESVPRQRSVVGDVAHQKQNSGTEVPLFVDDSYHRLMSRCWLSTRASPSRFPSRTLCTRSPCWS